MLDRVSEAAVRAALLHRAVEQRVRRRAVRQDPAPTAEGAEVDHPANTKSNNTTILTTVCLRGVATPHDGHIKGRLRRQGLEVFVVVVDEDRPQCLWKVLPAPHWVVRRHQHGG